MGAYYYAFDCRSCGERLPCAQARGLRPSRPGLRHNGGCRLREIIIARSTAVPAVSGSPGLRHVTCAQVGQGYGTLVATELRGYGEMVATVLRGNGGKGAEGEARIAPSRPEAG